MFLLHYLAKFNFKVWRVLEYRYCLLLWCTELGTACIAVYRNITTLSTQSQQVNNKSKHRQNIYLEANSASAVASTFARTTGGSFSFSRLAAFSYSGASFLQWPHLTIIRDSSLVHHIQQCNTTRQHSLTALWLIQVVLISVSKPPSQQWVQIQLKYMGGGLVISNIPP